MSALPASSAPISAQAERAPLRGHRQRLPGVSQSAGSGDWILLTWQARRMASNMLRPSEQVLPSVPIPTFSPASSIARVRATPTPSRRLLVMGDRRAALREPLDVLVVEPHREAVNRPTIPSSSRCAASVLPYLRRPTTA